jgi:hypothetical protein
MAGGFDGMEVITQLQTPHATQSVSKFDGSYLKGIHT